MAWQSALSSQDCMHEITSGVSRFSELAILTPVYETSQRMLKTAPRGSVYDALDNDGQTMLLAYAGAEDVVDDETVDVVDRLVEDADDVVPLALLDGNPELADTVLELVEPRVIVVGPVSGMLTDVVEPPMDVVLDVVDAVIETGVLLETPLVVPLEPDITELWVWTMEVPFSVQVVVYVV
jgi:hypothetical protein